MVFLFSPTYHLKYIAKITRMHYFLFFHMVYLLPLMILLAFLFSLMVFLFSPTYHLKYIAKNHKNALFSILSHGELVTSDDSVGFLVFSDRFLVFSDRFLVFSNISFEIHCKNHKNALFSI